MKQIASKLDPHRDELLAWLAPQPEGEGLTLEAAIARLKESHGVSSSRSRLSTWLERARQAQMQAHILARIASGAEMSRDLERQFARTPAPEVGSVVKLLRVIVMQLSVQSSADPALLELVNPLMRSILDFLKVEQKEAQLKLDREKWESEAAEMMLSAALRQKADELNASGLSRAEKIAAMRAAAFKDVEALQASGKLKIPK